MGLTESSQQPSQAWRVIRRSSNRFADDLSITNYDPDHSEAEDRYITVGWSNRGRLLIVAHADRNNQIRIISARELTPTERKAYEE